ncbi:unnamed protein product [Brachionus calyciflorus]|uniref:C2H2-type domain-containing protein n=1 Tax=Brachionus calyciflorus TaxID=104777 RepID=A0A814KJF1_9BILA|nr:unnamed protein product [Brachionus calyciflorus]
MSTNKKRLFIDLTKSIMPNKSAKYRRTSTSGITANSECSNTSLLYSASSSVSSDLIIESNSIKCSPTPSITSDSLISDDISSNKFCSASSQTGRNSCSSISTISLSSDDGDKTMPTNTTDNNINNNNNTNNTHSSYSNSPSNESLNSNKRITRNASRAMETSNPFLNKSSSTSSLSTSHQDDSLIDPNRKKCLWNRCRFSVEANKSNDELIEHVKNRHILSQKSCKKFHCLWKGCNVYDRPSTSFMWLERHVTDHIDLRPYSCLFSGCNRKFRTETELVKHCDLHCNTNSTTTLNSNSLTSQLSNISAPMQTSPVKNRQQKHIILNTAKKALIQNIKQKNKSSSQLNELNSANPSSNVKLNALNGKAKSSSNLMNQKTNNSFPNGLNNNNNNSNNSAKFQNYSQILKALTKKRKNTEFNKKKFKKAQFKDFVDACSLKVIDDKLNQLNYQSGTCTFHANIIASSVNISDSVETFLVEWYPKNILENEWIEREKLTLTKTVDVNDLFKTCKLNRDEHNPFYSRHRFRNNKRK